MQAKVAAAGAVGVSVVVPAVELVCQDRRRGGVWAGGHYALGACRTHMVHKPARMLGNL